MVDLNKIVGNFGVFAGYFGGVEERRTCQRVNSSYGLPIINRRYLGDGSFGQDKSDKNIAELIHEASGFDIKQVRYILVKFVEEWGSEYERASYLLRMSVGQTHVGIVGMVMDELREKNLGLVPTLDQSAHHEPTRIANAEEGAKAHYAHIEGSGFIAVDIEEKTVIIYGTSPAFFVQYKRQVNEFLGMTGHEFVAKILEAHLPEDWECIAVNNHSQPTLSDSGLGENYPVPPEKTGKLL